MNTLDNPRPGIDETSVPFFQTALRFGVIGGLISITFAMVGQLTGISKPTNMFSSIIVGLVSILITILIGYFTIRHHREKELGGYISFGRAFLVAFVALLISTVLGTLFNLLYFNVIDPGAADEMIAAVEEMFANMGMDEEMMEMQLDQMRKNMSTAGLLKNGLLWGPVVVAIITLIQGAIMKKEQPVV